MNKLMFLNNLKGKALLQPTNPVVVSHRFYEAFKHIEEPFDYNKDRFRFRNDGRGRLVHHITKSDIQLFITIQAAFNTKGALEFCNRNRIYQKQAELFETPVTNDQFYVSFQKFVDLGLIEPVREEITGTYHYTLSQYLQPDTGTIGYYFLLPPAVYTEAFGELPLAAQKWYLEAAAQQNDRPDKTVEKNLRNDGKDGGLYKLLHKTNLNQIRGLLELLCRRPVMDGQPLFAASAAIKPNATGYYKASYSINPYYIIKKEKGASYHDVVRPKRPYYRMTRFIREQLEKLGIGELEQHNQGQTLIQLVTLMKKKSLSFIRYVLLKIKDLYRKHRIFPLDLLQFVKDEVRNQGIALYLDIARKTGLYPFIAPRGRDEIGKRSYEFAAAVSRFDLKSFRTMCKTALPILNRDYTSAPVHSPAAYRRANEALEQRVGRQEAGDIRAYAYKMQADPDEYRVIEEYALKKFRQESPSAVMQWMLTRIAQLPKWKRAPDVPHGFKLEHFLVNCISSNN
ncbi:hypothetical protein N0M98_22635 [Paenibacillus doosanensis]|uniref:hypothetical protein n=1 Tax=Paenibacillus doosanensis TaxID=1229154 RepID=UPI0021804E62|nr:hypothetical protein [Paenibacillus doosanensis]MCS7462927.1 hypothetical protein [Paenibacillus doosanensis]